jgi:hypothetical protein
MSAVQHELPFAFVEGKAITDVPQDLYIPPDALSISILNTLKQQKQCSLSWPLNIY